MEAMVMPLSDEIVENRNAILSTLGIDDELDLLAFELWQRASCGDSAAEEIWVDIEESVLAPH